MLRENVTTMSGLGYEEVTTSTEFAPKRRGEKYQLKPIPDCGSSIPIAKHESWALRDGYQRRCFEKYVHTVAKFGKGRNCPKAVGSDVSQWWMII